MIQEAYCSFEVSKLLKEKGFDWPCRAYITLDEEGHSSLIKVNDVCQEDLLSYQYLCPTHQMAMSWLRGKGIAVVPFISGVLDNKSFLWDITICVAETNDTYSQGWVYEEYDKAVKAALKYALTNLI